MKSLAEQPKKEVCGACARPTNKNVKYLNDWLCNRCASVLWAAQALLDNDYSDEQEIIPTMVVGALSAENERLEELRESVATIEWGSARGRLLRQRFWQVFEPHSIWALVDGVPIIHRNPIQVASLHSDEEIEKITIDVVDVSAKPEQVAKYYKETLELHDLDAHFSEEGEIGWQIAPGIIHMMVYPALVDPDIDSIRRSLKKQTPQSSSFPPPGLVGEIYSTLRGTKAKGKFRGFGRSILPGNLTNKPKAKTLVPACVAWYLADREKPSDYDAKIRIAELLNRHLSAPCKLESLSKGGSDFIQLWNNVSKHAETLKRVEEGFVEALRRRDFAPDFFSPSEKK